MRYFFLFLFMVISVSKAFAQTANLYEYNSKLEPRWSSPENFNGIKGNGGKENGGAKGHPYDTIGAGSSKELLKLKKPALSTGFGSL